MNVQELIAQLQTYPADTEVATVEYDRYERKMFNPLSCSFGTTLTDWCW